MPDRSPLHWASGQALVVRLLYGLGAVSFAPWCEFKKNKSRAAGCYAPQRPHSLSAEIIRLPDLIFER